MTEALAACGDEALLELEVVSVTPAAGPGRLLMTLRPSGTAPPREAGFHERRVAAALGFLRGEVAAAVHRRKAPELVARVVARPGR